MATSMTSEGMALERRGTGARPAVLTVEMALYAAISLVALAVRLAYLGRWPLLPTGLQTALAAWRTVHGESARPDLYVPLLYDANLALFWLTEASDAVARLLPALAGAALVWLPYLGRDYLGRVGALAAALLLALAPGWVFYSRTADWPILSAFFGALLVAALWRYVRGGGVRASRVAAVALGLGLTAGPGMITTLLGLGIVVATTRLFSRDGERWAPLGAALRALGEPANLWLAGGSFLLAGSALLANVDGVGQSVAWVGRWVAALRPEASGLGPFYYLTTLVIYEPLTIALALTGVVWGVARREALDTGLALWALMALLLGTALGHRDPAWLLDALLPLVVLAGRGAQRAWDALRPGFTVQDGIAVYGAFIVVGFGLVALTRYVHVADDAWRGYAMLTAGALLVAWVAYWLWAGDQGIRVGAVVALTLLAGLTVRASTALAYQTGRDPREPILRNPTSVQMRDLETLVASTAAHFVTDRVALTVEYERALGDVMGWYLRDYPLASEEPMVRAGAPVATVLIRHSEGPADWPAQYVGQAFRLRETWDWSTSGLLWHDRLRWFLFREPVGTEGAETVHCWVRLLGR